jgi:hypothetical protein
MTASLTAADVFGHELDTVADQLYRDIPSYARTLSAASDGAISVDAQEQILRLRADLFFQKRVPIGTLAFANYGGSCWVTLPLSTGSVHVSISCFFFLFHHLHSCDKRIHFFHSYAHLSFTTQN